MGKPATWLSQVESSCQKDCKDKGPEVAEGPLWPEWVTGWGGKKGKVIGPNLQLHWGRGEHFGFFCE